MLLNYIDERKTTVAHMKGRKISIKIEEIVSWIYALYGVRAVWLAFNSIEYMPTFYILNQMIGYLCIPVGMLLLLSSKYRFKKGDFFLILLPFTYWIMCIFNTYGGWEIGNGAVTFIQISIFLLLSREIKAKIFSKFYKIIQGCNIIALFVWLCYQLNIPIGIQTVKFYTGGYAVYRKWFIFAIYHNKSSLTILNDRLCGIFNEPGALGTICALLFIATFKYTKKWEKVLILVTGFFTYSVAFFVLIFGYLIVYYAQKKFRYVVVAVAIGIFFLQIPKIDFGNQALNNLAARLEITDTGLAGDNRLSDSYRAGYEAMKQTEHIYFGYGKNFSFLGDSSSYVNYIVQFGYIGFGIMILQWGIASLRRTRNKEQLIFILFFFISLYQRPAPIVSILGYILIFGGLSWMNLVENSGKEMQNKVLVS